MAWESTSQQKLISNTEKNLCFRDFCVVQGDRDTPRSGYRWLSAQGAFLALKQDQALCLLSSTELSLGQTNPKLLWSKAPPHSWMHVIPLPNCSPTQTSIILPVGVSETNTHNFYYFHNGKKKKFIFPCCPNSKPAKDILFKFSDNNAISENVYRSYFRMPLTDLEACVYVARQWPVQLCNYLSSPRSSQHKQALKHWNKNRAAFRLPWSSQLRWASTSIMNSDLWCCK